MYAHASLDDALKRQEFLLRERCSRIKRLKNGDRNTTFFHSLLKAQVQQSLFSLEVNGTLTHDHKAIFYAIISY